MKFQIADEKNWFNRCMWIDQSRKRKSVQYPVVVFNLEN